MFILCDTSSILMLLRIAPDMFSDGRYECKTIHEIHDEIVQTTKFKNKYPWTRNVRPQLRISVLTPAQKQQEILYFEAVKVLNRERIYNEEKKRWIDLSWRDMKLLSHTLAFVYKMSAGDDDLEYFARTQFKEEFGGNVMPLEIIIHWLEAGVITWDAEKQGYLSAWATDGEHPQLLKAKKRFKELTGIVYSGS
jgi:hypothetical protein